MKLVRDNLRGRRNVSRIIMVVAALPCIALASSILERDTFESAFYGAITFVVLSLAALVRARGIRVRRIWRTGELVEATVIKSVLLWHDYQGTAYGITMTVSGTTLEFNYPYELPLEKRYQTLLGRKWALVVIDDRAQLVLVPWKRA
ncbi:MAG: hypothetical protein ACM31C_18450 [Acidobacteriota bacterium]